MKLPFYRSKSLNIVRLTWSGLEYSLSSHYGPGTMGVLGIQQWAKPVLVAAFVDLTVYQKRQPLIFLKYTQITWNHTGDNCYKVEVPGAWMAQELTCFWPGGGALWPELKSHGWGWHGSVGFQAEAVLRLPVTDSRKTEALPWVQDPAGLVWISSLPKDYQRRSWVYPRQLPMLSAFPAASVFKEATGTFSPPWEGTGWPWFNDPEARSSHSISVGPAFVLSCSNKHWWSWDTSVIRSLNAGDELSCW